MKLIVPFVIAASLHAQIVGMPETILAQPVPNVTTNQIVLAEIQAAHAPGVQEAQGVIGSPIGISANTVMLSWPPPSEAFSVFQVGAPGLVNRVFVRRGMYSTYPHTPAQGTLIWLGPGSFFRSSNPSGRCDATALPVLPVVTIPSGVVWNCVSGNWKQGITWDEDAGWWATQAIQWRSI